MIDPAIVDLWRDRRKKAPASGLSPFPLISFLGAPDRTVQGNGAGHGRGQRAEKHEVRLPLLQVLLQRPLGGKRAGLPEPSGYLQLPGRHRC